ncbi:DUF6520 family protein [Pedobacter agri]|uniref:DUF6520 family protein n=1 Tax=Pedobacter agri TaxID=454586 RepID=UPI00292D1F35|nr:DUF6520 family protein [Pedobacter agri]
MKNFQLLLAGAIMIAVGSSFAAANNDSAADQYHLNGDIWELNSPEADCIQNSNTVCDYLKTGSATTPQYPNENQNPANFTQNRIGMYVE